MCGHISAYFRNTSNLYYIVHNVISRWWPHPKHMKRHLKSRCFYISFSYERDTGREPCSIHQIAKTHRIDSSRVARFDSCFAIRHGAIWWIEWGPLACKHVIWTWFHVFCVFQLLYILSFLWLGSCWSHVVGYGGAMVGSCWGQFGIILPRSALSDLFTLILNLFNIVLQFILIFLVCCLQYMLNISNFDIYFWSGCFFRCSYVYTPIVINMWVLWLNIGQCWSIVGVDAGRFLSPKAALVGDQ